ncbi:GerAB/ArcD/ProY family transporter [Paenibacillus sp. URB8-2]|uniref:GerAB/ArcD/ProY family transporter n=1 Tax=Paenibacillus sp. URB8-2 TaxID=2741301 RepID=UPI0015C28636|nr:endospore germination permease [Paenibacillus sp. URB8-2]BCG57711.1 spore germination protein KB [Paenibacillus sp. URB8-2]
MSRIKKRVTGLQISLMVILFEIGSTPLFLLGADAKQDSWLAMSAGAAAGFALLLLFMWLQQRLPEMELPEMLRFGFGRIAGTFFGIVYSCYFAYQSMRNLRDFGELTALIMLEATPISITMLVFVIIAGYAIWKGAEIIFRLPEILLPGLLFCYFLLIILFLLMGNVDIRRLTPVAENGLWPILQAALPEILSFPFGQMIVFLVLWPLWEKSGVPVKHAVWAYIGVSLFLIFMNALNMAILGPVLAGSSYLPFLHSVRTLSSLRFIERLDILVTLMIFIGLFIKMLIWFYCAVEVAASLTNTSAKRWVFPFGALIYAASFIERSYTQHITIGLGPSTRIDTIFQIAIPLILALAAVLRGRSSRSSA